MNHPEYFTGKSPEMGRVNPDNMSILIDHVKCASFELPFVKGELFGEEDLDEILDYLSENKVLFQKGDKWFWTEEGYPADAVSLNRVSSDNFVVVDRTEVEAVIAEVDFSAALETLHPKAIYILEGEQYIVEEFDFENRKAFVRRSNSDYYTDAITYTKIAVLDVFDDTPHDSHRFYYGDVHVFSQVVGFKKLKFFTNENVGAGDLQLPQREMHTSAFWMTVRSQLLNNLDIPSEEKLEAVAGIAYLTRHISAVMLMCDVMDIGSAVEDNVTNTDISINKIRKISRMAEHEKPNLADFEPNIYIYDNYPGGVGLAESLYEKTGELFSKILEVIEGCGCLRGCPSCVGPPIRGQGNHKQAAAYIVKMLMGEVYN